LGLDLKKNRGGAGLKRSNFFRGFSTEYARHKKNSRNCMFLHGIICKSTSTSMAGRTEFAAGQNSDDLGHERARGAGELREEVEGNPFYRLPIAKEHRGGWNLIGTEAPVVVSRRTMRAAFCSWRADLATAAAA
jgi:hypothetical protein